MHPQMRKARCGIICSIVNMDNFKSNSIKDLTIFFSDFSSFWKIAIHFLVPAPYGLKLWGCNSVGCIYLNFTKKNFFRLYFWGWHRFLGVNFNPKNKPFFKSEAFRSFLKRVKERWIGLGVKKRLGICTLERLVIWGWR